MDGQMDDDGQPGGARPDADDTGSADAGGALRRVRVSDAERESIVARLNAATSEGRLTLEEFSDRVSQALAARTRGDLDRVMVDLPAGGLPAPMPATATTGYPPVPSSSRTSQVTPLGAVKRSGRWRLDRDTDLGTVVGAIKLDLRQAEMAAPEVHLHVHTVVGSVKIWIPRGISVQIEGSSVLGSRSITEEAPRPGAPLLRLRIDTVVGSVKVYRS